MGKYVRNISDEIIFQVIQIGNIQIFSKHFIEKWTKCLTNPSNKKINGWKYTVIHNVASNLWIQIKITMLYDCFSVRITVRLCKNKWKTNDFQCWQQGRTALMACWLKCEMVKFFWKTFWHICQELNKHLSFDDPAIPLQSVHSCQGNWKCIFTQESVNNWF